MSEEDKTKVNRSKKSEIAKKFKYMVLFLQSDDMSGIILFDGNCNLCNRNVQFLIRRDPKQYF